jgi:hypothetical protein
MGSNFGIYSTNLECRTMIAWRLLHHCLIRQESPSATEGSRDVNPITPNVCLEITCSQLHVPIQVQETKNQWGCFCLAVFSCNLLVTFRRLWATGTGGILPRAARRYLHTS